MNRHRRRMQRAAERRVRFRELTDTEPPSREGLNVADLGPSSLEMIGVVLVAIALPAALVSAQWWVPALVEWWLSRSL